MAYAATENRASDLAEQLAASLARETKLREALIKLDKIYRSEMDEPENNPRPKWLSEALALSIDKTQTFQQEHWEWVQKTFPGETAEGVLHHLCAEIQEFSVAPTDFEEMADIFLLMQCYASHVGVDFMGQVRAKFEKCKARKWVKTSTGWRHEKAALSTDGGSHDSLP
jgi:hypothetical protein